MATTKNCPKCEKKDALRFWIRSGYDIDFDLQKANQTIICPNCKRKISYSVQPVSDSKTV